MIESDDIRDLSVPQKPKQENAHLSVIFSGMSDPCTFAFSTLVAALAKGLSLARCLADKERDNEEDDARDTSCLANLAFLAAFRIPVVECELHA